MNTSNGLETSGMLLFPSNMRLLPILQTNTARPTERLSTQPQIASNQIATDNLEIGDMAITSLRDHQHFRYNWNQSRTEQPTEENPDNKAEESISILNVPVNKTPDILGLALGMAPNDKVFTFNHLNTPECYSSPYTIPAQETGQREKKQNPTELRIISSVSDTGIRSDYYSNLVSWSTSTRKITIGLENSVYIWTGGSEGNSIIIFDDREEVTCVSCSPGIYLIVGTSGGNIYLLKQDNNELIGTYKNGGHHVNTVAWFKDGKRFLVGDNSGTVLYLEVIQSFSQILIALREILKCHSDRICGIAISSDEKQIAFGSNDRTVTVWDLRGTQVPQLKYILPHGAAVKALTFCPWAKSLLVTGGGLSDRTIRFWHTKSGTLVKHHFTNSQITSVLWCLFRKELIVTFGTGENGRSVAVYSYPDMFIRRESLSSEHLAMYSASISPEGSLICCATNNQDIRVYRIYEKKEIKKAKLHPQSGTYGSSLLEISEGIAPPVGGLR